MNFTNVNGIQYISIVDERNRRGRPPKAKRDVPSAEAQDLVAIPQGQDAENEVITQSQQKLEVEVEVPNEDQMMIIDENNKAQNEPEQE